MYTMEVNNFLEDASVIELWNKRYSNDCGATNQNQSPDPDLKERMVAHYNREQNEFEGCEFGYKFRKSYTLSNFCKTISKQQVAGFALCATPLAVGLLEVFSEWVSKGDIREAILENEKTAELNRILQAAYDETGEKRFFKEFTIQDPRIGTLADPFDMQARRVAYYVVIPAMAIVGGAEEWCEDMKRRLGKDVMAGIVLGLGAFGGGLLFCLNNMALPSVSPIFENKFIAGGTILATYIVGCSLYNLNKMRTWEKGSVTIENLAEVLKSDIVIE